MGQGDLPFDSHIRWRLDFRKCFRLVVGKGMSSRGRGGIVNPGGRHAKSRGKRACERVADAFAGPSQSQTTTLCQARSPTTTPLLSSPLLSSLAYLSPSSSPLIPCVVLSTRAAPSNNQKRRRTRRRAASTRLISLFPLLSLQIGGWVAGVHRMDPIFQRAFSDPLYLEENVVQQGIERCPFLRNINEPTSFSLSSVSFPVPARGAKGPIFEDGPNFDMAFRVFHGRDGVVPLSEGSFPQIEKPLPKPNSEFNPLAAKAATISLSAFGGFFSFGDFSNKRNKKNSNKKNPNNLPQNNGGQSNNHEALSNEWLEMGQCPLAKSYRALSGVVPLVAKMMTPPAGMKLRCPPAVVAARAALSRTAFAKGLRPQPLPTKILVIALLGMAANVPLGIWREHTEKFSVQWFAAVHAAVPFIGILRKSVLMPKTAMALTIAASILGQTIGSRAERIRLKRAAAKLAAEGHGDTATRIKAPMSLKTGSCSVVQLWDPLALKIESTVSPVLVPAVGAFD